MGRGRQVDAEVARNALAAGDVSHLSAREHAVLRLRADGVSMTDVAKQLDLTTERVRQLQVMGLRILRATQGRPR